MIQHVDLAIVAALPEELEAIETRWPGVPLGDSPEAEGSGWTLRRPAEGITVATACCGYRAKRIGPLLAELTAKTDAQDLILLGCCGALEKNLAVLEPVIALGHVAYVDDSRFVCDKTLTARLAESCPDCRSGWFATSPAVLPDEAGKSQCANKTGALTVEMEGVHVAGAAFERGLRFASIRWVLDTLEDALQGDASVRPDDSLELSEIMQRLLRVSEAATTCIQRLFER